MSERQMEHLGDGLCADFDGERVRLFSPTEHGIIEVYFSQEVLLAFLAYVARIGFWQPIEEINKPADDSKLPTAEDVKGILRVEHKDDSA